jgi:AbrB family looped-hinge helix DNA binding protein
MTRPKKASVTVSSKGQIILPAQLRHDLDIRQGDRLILELQPDGAILMRREENRAFQALIGAWRGTREEPLDVDATIAELRDSIEE